VEPRRRPLNPDGSPDGGERGGTHPVLRRKLRRQLTRHLFRFQITIKVREYRSIATPLRSPSQTRQSLRLSISWLQYRFDLPPDSSRNNCGRRQQRDQLGMGDVFGLEVVGANCDDDSVGGGDPGIIFVIVPSETGSRPRHSCMFTGGEEKMIPFLAVDSAC